MNTRISDYEDYLNELSPEQRYKQLLEMRIKSQVQQDTCQCKTPLTGIDPDDDCGNNCSRCGSEILEIENTNCDCGEDCTKCLYGSSGQESYLEACEEANIEYEAYVYEQREIDRVMN